MLDDNQKVAFERDGFVVVPELLEAETLAALRTDYTTRLRELCAAWADDGRLPRDVVERDFDAQVLAALDAGLDYFQPLDISLPNADFAPDVPMFTSAAAFAMMRSPRVLDAIESLIGPEITSNPIQHVRIKPPAARVPSGEERAHIVSTDWHQDRAVARTEADATRMVTCWIAVTDATLDNGCLHALPGSHRQSLRTHCPGGRQLGIPARSIDTAAARPLPVGAGGAVLFHPLTVHGSRDNTGDTIRWSFDIRYHVTGEPSGRPQFPEFVARSRRDPDTELRDPDVWAARWWQARDTFSLPRSGERFNRWDGSETLCA